MTQQIINVGSAINDGTGDPARTAFTHCNENFTELYQVSRPTGNAIEFQFNNTVTEPPASGQIRFNQATQASTTKIWVSHTTSSGVNIKQFLAAATTGAKLVVQDKNDNTNYIKFDVTGVPVDKTTYWEFVVAVTASGGNLPNAAILAAVTAAGGGGGTSIVTAPQGRLTLVTATPVMTTTQSGKTTIFYTPYVGNLVPIYNGTSMVMTTFAELSVATTDTTKSPTAIGASKVNDWFVWSDAGTVRIGHGPDWTSDAARSAGTALTMVNGIWLNNVSITNGPAASRGTYVGTTRSNASSQLDWILGTTTAGGGAAFLNVWNCYNRVQTATSVSDNTASWTYAAVTMVPLNNGATGGGLNNRISFVCGLSEESFVVIFYLSIQATAGVTCYPGFALNSITTADRAALMQAANLTAVNCSNSYLSPIGFNFVQALQRGDGAGTHTMFGSNAGYSTEALNAITRM